MEPVLTLMQMTRSDLYIHSGDLLLSAADDQMIALAGRPRKDRAYLFLSTYGGYARCAYRIMRSLRHAYEHVTVVVAGPCKSAGTLLVIGADELVMTGGGELGPLDVQILKDNEIAERQSGLVVQYAFDTLSREARTAFSKAFLDMKLGGRLTTATAADATAKVVVGLMGPIFAQIDPIRVGEVTMAQLVAHRYAEALTKHEGKDRSNVRPETIKRLLSNYPSHDYAIDRQEAMELFKLVRAPNAAERQVISYLLPLLSTPAKPATTLRVPDTLETRDDPGKTSQPQGDAGPAAGGSAPHPDASAEAHGVGARRPGKTTGRSAAGAGGDKRAARRTRGRSVPTAPVEGSDHEP